MGRVNATFNRCIQDNKRFADCINLAFGKKVVEANNFGEMDTSLLGRKNNKNDTYEKQRDVIKYYNIENAAIIFAIESQTEINNAMVLRKMIYDAYEYDKQLSKLRNEHYKLKDLKGAEYLAGFSKADKIIPIITVCVYFGKEKWDAPLCLYELINFNVFPTEQQKLLKQMIDDVHMILLDVRHMPEENFELMDSDLKHLFAMIRVSQDKRAMKAYIEENFSKMCDMEEDLYNAIVVYTHTKELEKIKESVRNEMGGINMCKAFDDLMKDERKAGMKKGTERVNMLNRYLVRDGREADLLKSVSNKVFQKKLFAEYGI